MAPVLLRRLAGDLESDWLIEHCRVVQTRRRISRRTREDGAAWLGVCYELALRNARSGQLDSHWLYAKAYTQGRSAQAWQTAMPLVCVMPRLGEPVMHVAELDLVLWALPNDPAMAQLPAFLDPVAVAPHLPPGLVSRDPAAAAQAVSAVRIVRYEPEEHCLARFVVCAADSEVAIFGKSYATDAWRDARDGLDALWRRGCEHPRAFVVGRPLGSSAALRVVWQAEVQGEPLAERMAGAEAEATLDTLAQALSHLHAGTSIARAQQSLGETLEVARKWRKKLVQADASLAPALDAVLLQLEHRALPPRRLVTIHGDFHLDQMMWANGRIALFDYDNFGIDSAARDLGDFVSQLLCREGRQADWAALAARFVECYRACCDEALSDQELEWYLRLMLLRKAYSFFVRHREGWRQRALHAVLAAQAGLAVLPRRIAEVC